MEFITDLLEVRMFTGVWNFHVHTSSHSSAQISRARGEITTRLIVLKANLLVELVDGVTQALEHRFDVTSFLHADDSEVILLINPHQERFIVVVEDSSTLRPHLIDAGSFQKAVPLLEQEVVFDKLLPGLFAHAGQRIVLAREISGQRRQDINNLKVMDIIKFCFTNKEKNKVFLIRCITYLRNKTSVSVFIL